MEEKLQAIENFIEGLVSKYGEPVKDTVIEYALYRRNRCIVSYLILLVTIFGLFYIRKRFVFDEDYRDILLLVGCVAFGMWLVVFSISVVPYIMNPVFATFDSLTR